MPGKTNMVKLNKTVQFIADKVRISGPKIDGGYVISFEVGEHMANKVSEIIRLPQNTALKVDITPLENED